MVDKAEEVKEEEKSETTDFEKRYNDSQEHIKKLETENSTYRDDSQKDKQLFDQISQFVDWDAVNGKKTETDEEGYVDKATLNKTISDLRGQMDRDRVTQDFRTKYPDMVPYEDLVTVYFGKTDARRPVEERVEKAVGYVKKLLETERAKGVETHEAETKEKVAKEAEVGGLGEKQVPAGEKQESDGETFDEYIAARKQGAAKAQGLV